MNLSMEQRLLIYAVSHDYILLNGNCEMEDDVKKALCGAFIANKINYKPSDLMRDITYLEQLGLIDKDRREKKYFITFSAEQRAGIIINDSRKNSKNILPIYNIFMNTFWSFFCSFIRAPIGELLKSIESTKQKSRNVSDLGIESDMMSAILCDLAIKRGLVMRDANGYVFLTDSGKNMLAASTAQTPSATQTTAATQTPTVPPPSTTPSA